MWVWYSSDKQFCMTERFKKKKKKIGGVVRSKLENLDQVLNLPSGLREPFYCLAVFWQLSSYPYWQG